MEAAETFVIVDDKVVAGFGTRLRVRNGKIEFILQTMRSVIRGVTLGMSEYSTPDAASS